MTTPGTNSAENYSSHPTEEILTLLMSVPKQQNTNSMLPLQWAWTPPATWLPIISDNYSESQLATAKQ